MLQQLIQILIICVVVGVIWWVADYLPVPEPLNKILKVVSMIVGIIAVLYVLIHLAGMVSLP